MAAVTTDQGAVVAVAGTTSNARDDHVLEFLRWKEKHGAMRRTASQWVRAHFIQGACMQFELITADGRLFDLDVWDWSMMVGGSLLVGLVALLG
jgi:hypothetical protein